MQGLSFYIRIKITLPFYSTELLPAIPAKDETSETIVRNLYCPFPYVHDS